MLVELSWVDLVQGSVLLSMVTVHTFSDCLLEDETLLLRTRNLVRLKIQLTMPPKIAKVVDSWKLQPMKTASVAESSVNVNLCIYQFLPTWCYTSMGAGWLWLDVCICHKSELYWNGWMNPAPLAWNELSGVADGHMFPLVHSVVSVKSVSNWLTVI